MIILLPPEIRHYEVELRIFVDLMVQKLRINRHKGLADGTTQEYVTKLKGEVDELVQSIGSMSQMDVALEAADVANMAFLLSLVVLRKTKPEFKKEQADN